MNNNPGNLRPVGSSSGFQQFDTPEAGLQAMRNDLLAKLSGNSTAMKARFGEGYQPTLSTVIATYAPPSENDTSHYVNVVSNDTGIDPHQPLSPADVDKIIPSMVKMESGPATASQLTGGAANDSIQQTSNTFNVKLPDGTLIQGVPVGTTKEQIRAKFEPKGFKFDAGQKLSDTMQETPPGALGQLGNQLSDRWQQGVRDVHSYPAMAPIVGLGVATGAANDVTGAVTNAVIPDVVKRGLASGAQTTADAVDSTEAGQWAGDKLLAAKNAYNDFTQSNPKTAIALNTAGNVASFIPTERAVESAVRTAAPIAENAVNGIGAMADRYAAKYPVGTGPLDPLAVKTATPATQITPEALEAGALMHYDDAEKMGGVIKPHGFQDTLNTIKKKVGYQTPEGIAFAGENPVTETIAKLDKMQEMPISLKGLDEIDGQLNSKISVAMRSGDNDVARKLLEIKGMLKNASSSVKPEDLVNPEAFDSWRKGDVLWSAKSKMRQLQDIVDNAHLTDNPDSAMRSSYRALSKRLSKNPAGWTPEEIDLIRRGAQRGLAAGALKIIGSRLMSGLIGAAAGTAGGPIGTVAGALAGEAAGFPLRAAGNALQEGRAMAPVSAVANRPSVINALPTSAAEIAKLPISQQKAAFDALLKTRTAKSAPVQLRK